MRLSRKKGNVILKESAPSYCGRTTEVMPKADSPLAKIHLFDSKNGCLI